MNLNALKKQVEQSGTNWNDALAKIKEAAGGKDIAAAMKEGWKVVDFAKVLEINPDESEGESMEEQASKEPQPEDHSPVAHTEAPASLNTYYISPGGFRWQFTIRPGLDGKEMIILLKQAKSAEEWFLKKGYKPYVPYQNSRANASDQQATAADGETPICPTHNRPMKPSKHGKGFYCPTKIADDDGTGKPSYCKYKVE